MERKAERAQVEAFYVSRDEAMATAAKAAWFPGEPDAASTPGWYYELAEDEYSDPVGPFATESEALAHANR